MLYFQIYENTFVYFFEPKRFGTFENGDFTH